ncbi:probable 2-oxoglutarate-dependent dioxygenase AOP1 [Euphorbia lathyris]|uniref:probable 2-oxoglutarate-dependent dioxygenase AOP1 n=1 Tax=Euphorbia lathyris TaxID=212925 RepID=UPI003313C2A4
MGSLSPVPNLPILDLKQDHNLKPGTSLWQKRCSEVRQALEEYGCFIAEYNKLSPEFRDDMFGVMKELFDLPTLTKMQNKYDKPLNGYVGQIPKLPLHESMGIDDATSLNSTQHFTNLMWPNGNPHFCECLYEYAKIAAEIDGIVSRMIFESYGAQKHLRSYMDSTCYLLRLIKTGVPNGDHEHNLGFVSHTDKSFTTILHQNHVDGLQVDTKDGHEIDVHFSPSSFVVIAGDALMAWSSDRIKSPSHRVIMKGKVDRYSMGLFAFNSGIIETPEELIDEEHPLMYKPLNHIGLLHFYRTEEGYKSECPLKAYCGI